MAFPLCSALLRRTDVTENQLSGVRRRTWPDATLFVPAGQLRPAQPFCEAIEVLGARRFGAVGRNVAIATASGPPARLTMPICRTRYRPSRSGPQPPFSSASSASAPNPQRCSGTTRRMSARIGSECGSPGKAAIKLDLRRQRPLRLPERREARAEDPSLDPRRPVTGRRQNAFNRGGSGGRRAEARPQLLGRAIVGHRDRVGDQLPLPVRGTALARASTARAIGTLIVDQATPPRRAPSSSIVRSGADRSQSASADRARDRRLERLEARPVSRCQKRPNRPVSQAPPPVSSGG